MAPEGLRDIHGLDPISIWPLADGWWFLLGGIALIVTLVLAWRMLSPKITLPRRRGWHGDARRLLRDLRRRLPALDGRTASGEFSVLMRRIAMARTARDECAGLSGNAWLAWLSTNDPAGFDWGVYGRLLLEVPYAPPGAEVDMDDVRRLIDAAEHWVADSPPPQAAQATVQEAA